MNPRGDQNLRNGGCRSLSLNPSTSTRRTTGAPSNASDIFHGEIQPPADGLGVDFPPWSLVSLLGVDGLAAGATPTGNMSLEETTTRWIHSEQFWNAAGSSARLTYTFDSTIDHFALRQVLLAVMDEALAITSPSVLNVEELERVHGPNVHGNMFDHDEDHSEEENEQDDPARDGLPSK